MLISGKTASSCLERLCIGTAPSADQLENESVSVDQVIEWARRRGLRAKLIPLSWEELQNLISSDPVLLALRNGNTVLALRNGASAEEIVVADPLYEDGQEFFLPRHLLEDAWGGDAITLRRVSGPRKYKVGWVVSGFGTCMAALTIGAVFSVYPAQKVVRSFAELAHPLASSEAASTSVTSGPRSDPIASSVSMPETTSGKPDDMASLAADLYTQADFAAGVSLSAVIEPRTIADNSNAARPGADLSTIALSAPTPEMPGDDSKKDAVSEPQGDELDKTPTMLSRNPAGPVAEPRVGLAPTESDSAPYSPSHAAGESVPESVEASTETSRTQTEVKALRDDTARHLSTNLPRSTAASTTSVPQSSAVSAVLINRGDALMTTGDFISARQFYERAAESGDGHAALRMGETYDPAFLAQSKLNGIRGDALLAARWYLRALELGVPDAAVLFKAVVSANRH